MVIRQTRNTFVLLLTFAVIAGAYSWNVRTERIELYRSGLTPQELPQISRALTRLGFEHGFNERFDGFLVAPDEVIPARVALARSGLPREAGPAWDVDDPERFFEDQRLATAKAEVEECLTHYPELAEYRVKISLSCRLHSYLTEEHICERGYILALEHPDQKLSEAQVQGLLSLLALSEPRLRRVQVVRVLANSEPIRTSKNLDFRWVDAGWEFETPWGLE